MILTQDHSRSICRVVELSRKRCISNPPPALRLRRKENLIQTGHQRIRECATWCCLLQMSQHLLQSLILRESFVSCEWMFCMHAHVCTLQALEAPELCLVVSHRVGNEPHIFAWTRARNLWNLPPAPFHLLTHFILFIFRDCSIIISFFSFISFYPTILDSA